MKATKAFARDLIHCQLRTDQALERIVKHSPRDDFQNVCNKINSAAELLREAAEFMDNWGTLN